MAIGAAHAANLWEDWPVAENQRILDKLDELQSGQGTIAIDVARIQGAQKGTELAIQTLSSAIGDVTNLKIRAETLEMKVDGIVARIDAHDRKEAQAERDEKWQRWIERAVPALVSAGTIAGLMKLFHL